MTWRTARQYARTGGLFAATSSAPPASSSAPKQASLSPGPSSAPPSSSAPRPTPPPASFVPGPTPPTPSFIPGPTVTGFDPAPGPSIGYHPRSPDLTYHPPGPGIGLRPGPAPALGRPGLLPGNHGGWKNDSCYSQGSKGWKPDIMSLGDAHNCPGEKGPQGPPRPPNISGDPAGYNSRTFRDESNVAHALQYLGYQSPDGNAMIRRFQRHWNLVISRIATVPDRYRNIQFAHVPQGNLRVDGEIGPHTLNALEIAMVNQRMNPQLAWPNVIELVITAGNGYGKERLYNAAQGM